MLLEKTVKKLLLEIVSGSNFLSRLSQMLYEHKAFEIMIHQMMDARLEDSAFKRSVTAKVKQEVSKSREAIIVSLDDGDIVLLPSTGIGDDEFKRLTAMIPESRRLGIVAADNVRILKLS